ncbi:MAG: hypothetical protein OXU63_04455, partial [Acidobacteriota bacterium]|nr:hypothetical protein [Acidobacteriota bacterium]
NLTKIESRPIPATPWRYCFYLDIEGHAASVPVTEALQSIEAKAKELRILGTYPSALPPAPAERPAEDAAAEGA